MDRIDKIDMPTEYVNGENEPQKMIRKIGSTTYEVIIHFSETSSESLCDKVLRLIKNENAG